MEEDEKKKTKVNLRRSTAALPPPPARRFDEGNANYTNGGGSEFDHELFGIDPSLQCTVYSTDDEEFSHFTRDTDFPTTNFNSNKSNNAAPQSAISFSNVYAYTTEGDEIEIPLNEDSFNDTVATHNTLHPTTRTTPSTSTVLDCNYGYTTDEDCLSVLAEYKKTPYAYDPDHQPSTSSSARPFPRPVSAFSETVDIRRKDKPEKRKLSLSAALNQETRYDKEDGRDWNELLQTTLEMPESTLEQKIHRAKSTCSCQLLDSICAKMLFFFLCSSTLIHALFLFFPLYYDLSYFPQAFLLTSSPSYGQSCSSCAQIFLKLHNSMASSLFEK